jgi:hypothetical protein
MIGGRGVKVLLCGLQKCGISPVGMCAGIKICFCFHTTLLGIDAHSLQFMPRLS